ncbi:MAG TPA: alpha/beta hydrolase [Pyrinomonadaceae bacterium]|nr:alpha/beta hydrolase [Pyrinomonadaceae bacterium]
METTITLFALALLNLVLINGTYKAPAIDLQPCEVQGIREKVKCGTLEVFENRATKTGRKISLKILVAPATGPNRKSDPLFYIPGGPGSSATGDAPGVVSQFAKVREQRDLIFVDQRGTGGSHPLDCTFYDQNDPQTVFGSFFPVNDIKKCRQELEGKADLTLYTTPIAMDDLDEVRGALGYDQINIFGGSYGTRASLVYLKRHPKTVRTITLQGVVPSGDYVPFDFAQRTERALQGVIDECAADSACNGAFPNLRAELKTMLDRLLQGPVEVEINTNISTGPGSNNTPRMTKMKLSRDLAAEAIRYMLYNAGSAMRVPLVIHQAAAGEFSPIAQFAFRYRMTLVARGSNGMYLSVTCAEDLPWFKRADAEKRAANTLLGDYRVQQQLAACELWPRAKVDPNYAARSSVPVLMLTGQWDPVTPPSNAENAARFLPSSFQIVVPQAGHGFGGVDGIQCVQGLIAQFIDEGTTKNLNTACVKDIKRRPFVLK